ncbi:MAG: glycerophosphoryl diester phosphodiesterase, partial [Acidimicrobiaceae bacterium]|nr:glycerophosphoryl diester phosphodiesterase [Acidimicrobiaceae bacterium]
MVSILGARGAAALVRENTIEAFFEARRLGADGIELDVRSTSDGALVVHHDPAIAGMAEPIAATPVAELPEYVPLLAAVLDACGDMVVNVEVKNWPHEPGFDLSGRMAARVAGAVMEQGLATRVVISSFHLQTIDAVKAVEPSLRTALLTLTGYDQRAAVATVVDRGHDAVHPFHEAIDADLVAAAHDAGLTVAAWTVADRGAMVALVGVG